MYNKIDYRDKKVKIKVDDILEHVGKDRLSDPYIDFIKENRDTIFTAVPDYFFFNEKVNEHLIYTFRENDKWSFFYTNLEVVED